MKQLVLVIALQMIIFGCIECKYKVIINSKIERLVPEHVDTGIISNVKVTKMHYAKQDIPKDTLLSISDFKDLLILGITDQSLTIIPKFENLPTLADLSLRINKIQAVTKDSFKSISVRTLDLSSNEIETIEDKSFGPRVRYIKLGCNNLPVFNNKWFQAPAEIELLDLSKNKISVLHKHFFRSFTSMKYLMLAGNEIDRIKTDAFPFKSIDNLDLSYNKISEMLPDQFSETEVSIRVLNIQFNKLNYLPEELLGKLHVTNMSISGNPWQCPCLKDIESWMRDTSVEQIKGIKYENTPACVYATTHSKVCVPHTDLELYNTYITGVPTNFTTLHYYKIYKPHKIYIEKCYN